MDLDSAVEEGEIKSDPGRGDGDGADPTRQWSGERGPGALERWLGLSRSVTTESRFTCLSLTYCIYCNFLLFLLFLCVCVFFSTRVALLSCCVLLFFEHLFFAL